MATFANFLRTLGTLFSCVGWALFQAGELVETLSSADDESIFPTIAKQTEPDWSPLFLIGLGVWVGVKCHKFLRRPVTGTAVAAAQAGTTPSE